MSSTENVVVPFSAPADSRNLLTRAELKQRDRRFSGESITGFGTLHELPTRNVHETAAMRAAKQALHDERQSTNAGQQVRDLIERNGPYFNHHDFAIVLRAFEAQLNGVNVEGYDYSMVLDRLQEADGELVAAGPEVA